MFRLPRRGSRRGGIFHSRRWPGTLWALNLTSGQGGIGSTYTDADWLRSLRHGIHPNGENLIIMPAEFYTTIGIDDFADMIAYLKTLPPVDRETPSRALAVMPKVMLGLGVIPAHKIDHAAVPQSAPAPGEAVEYGQYMAMVCTAFHGPDLREMQPNGEGDKPASNLTPSVELGNWTEAEFIATLQTGLTPEGDSLDSVQMPWPRIGAANEEDLRAIWLYLQSLPTTPANP